MDKKFTGGITIVLIKTINSLEQLERELDSIRGIYNSIPSKELPLIIKIGTKFAFEKSTEVENSIVTLLIKYLTGTLDEKKLIKECTAIFKVMEALDGKPTKRIF